MGEIVNTKIIRKKIIYRILFDEDEMKSLKNCFTNIHLFSEESFKIQSKVLTRGNNGSSKYFVVPLSLKSRKAKKSNDAKCQKINFREKIFYVYTLTNSFFFCREGEINIFSG